MYIYVYCSKHTTRSECLCAQVLLPNMCIHRNAWQSLALAESYKPATVLAGTTIAVATTQTGSCVRNDTPAAAASGTNRAVGCGRHRCKRIAAAATTGIGVPSSCRLALPSQTTCFSRPPRFGWRRRTITTESRYRLEKFFVHLWCCWGLRFDGIL